MQIITLKIIITNDDVQILELSPELRDAFANQQQQQSSSSSIMDKLIQAEKDKMSKALVVWQSNDLTNLIVSNHNHNHQIEPRLYYQSSSSQDQPME
ncbi:hypothetical protein HUG17_9292 [Dermatophagoides farinae]|uniref:Uncharacterized protein n=1 Tax=Dermatophagoides farinae TaxID=6954 RepID=A0A9D4NUI2_DERFA|nr:hypothetical protein HUG17_9292 [Dermatophagoides farinae]